MLEGQEEAIDVDEFLDPFVMSSWEQAIPELQMLIDNGLIEIRKNDNTTIVTRDLVKAWLNQESATVNSLFGTMQKKSSVEEAEIFGMIPSDESFLTGDEIFISDTEFYLAYTGFLKRLSISIGTSDNDVTYELRLYKDPNSSGEQLVNSSILHLLGIGYVKTDLDVELIPGEYALAIKKIDGDTPIPELSIGVVEIGVEVETP